MERRAVVEFAAKPGNRLSGYAAVFDSISADLGGFKEIIRKGAFKRTLAEQPDIPALVHHRPELVLGRTGAGTMTITEDQRGLMFDIDVANTTAGRDVLTSTERGDIRGASFAFTVPNHGARWTQVNGQTVRELVDVNLHEITVTPLPAYTDTDVARRALLIHGRPRLTRARLWLETV